VYDIHVGLSDVTGRNSNMFDKESVKKCTCATYCVSVASLGGGWEDGGEGPEGDLAG